LNLFQHAQNIDSKKGYAKVFVGDVDGNNKPIPIPMPDRDRVQDLQTASSNKIRDSIILKYHLMQHYKIKESEC